MKMPTTAATTCPLAIDRRERRVEGPAGVDAAHEQRVQRDDAAEP